MSVNNTKNLSIRKAFNQHLLDFLEDVLTVLPNNKNIKLALESVRVLGKTKPKYIIENWKYYYNIHKQDIKQKGILFYTEYDPETDIKNESYMFMKDIISNVKESFIELSENDKDKTYRYIVNLNKMVELYEI